MLRPAEAHIRVVIEFESKKVGALLQGERNDCVRGRRDRQRRRWVVDELVLSIARGSKHLVEIRHCGIELILRIEIEQLGLRQIDLRETLVERGLELARS